MRPPAQALAGRTSEITYPGAAEHIRVVRTTQTGAPSGVRACDSRFFGSFFGLAVPATRNLTSLVSSFRRMTLSPSCVADIVGICAVLGRLPAASDIMLGLIWHKL
jgi:hypothetical protein